MGELALFSALQLFLATEVQENASDSDLFKLKARVIQWVRLALARVYFDKCPELPAVFVVVMKKQRRSEL